MNPPHLNRPTLVLLSGLLCDQAIWQDVAHRLSPSTDVRIFSFPGFSSIETMAEHVLSSLAGRFALAGHSMGGRVALEMVRRGRERVSGLALLNTGIHPRSQQEPASRARLVAIAHEQGMDALAAEWAAADDGPRTSIDGPAHEKTRRDGDPVIPGRFRRANPGTVVRPDAAAVLPTVMVPTLSIERVGRPVVPSCATRSNA